MRSKYSRNDRRNFVLVALILLFTAALLLAAAETIVRIREENRFGGAATPEQLLVYDPATTLTIPHPGFVSDRITINRLGFRGPEIAIPKPAGTVRLAFLGGSTTFCAEVGGDQAAWPHLVTQALQQAFPHVRFDYVNAGVPGYTVRLLQETFEKRVRALQPDIVVIYEATNDLSGDSRDVALAAGVISQRPERTSWLGRQSLLWYLVEKNLTVALRQRAAVRPEGKAAIDAEALARGFEARLDGLVQAVRGTVPTVALAEFAPRLRRSLPADERVRAAVTSAYYMPHLTIESMLDGFEAYNRAIRRAAGRHGALLIETGDAIPPDDAHYTDSVHFTDAGSAALARRVAAALADRVRPSLNAPGN
ncbi:MAG: SGNH/GDSL hydrolase family protein [Rhodospirillales bacterium]